MKTNGAYILKNDMLKDGYYYTIEDGKIKKNKYGWRQKIYEILKYGTTNHISYSYIRFAISTDKKDNSDLEVYTGNMSSEFTDLLKYLRYMRSSEKKPYRLDNENIYVRMVRGEENRILVSHDGQEIRYYFVDEYDGKEVMKVYTFYPF